VTGIWLSGGNWRFFSLFLLPLDVYILRTSIGGSLMPIKSVFKSGGSQANLQAKEHHVNVDEVKVFRHEDEWRSCF